MSDKHTEDAYQFGIATGEWMERERIISLLETEVMRLAETWGDTSWPEWVIALIKGEQK